MNTVLRAGAGLIYSHVPLLAQDFADNQTRQVTFLPGPNAGNTFTLQNVYLPGGSLANIANPEQPGISPKTFTWNIESETAIRKNITLRLSYYETHTDNLFLVNPILPTQSDWKRVSRSRKYGLRALSAGERHCALQPQ